jgi:malonate transporter MadL subunit
MKIYGVALLAFCFLLGKLLGNLLGRLMQINGDLGGVGFAMLFLMLSNSFLKRKGWMAQETEKGILFWSSMYIPIIVAMAATQNVKAALSGGYMAILAGAVTTFIAFAFVPLLSKIGNKKQTKKEKE